MFAVSDVYQDLFGEGSFTGKGIYDVDAFESALKGRIPENALLSHDLFEGIFARSGFVSDIEVIEDFPTRYEVAASRQHRWIRGDWQLLPWLIGLRGSITGDRRRDRIPALGRWKMFDNLRRSLLAPASTVALIAGFALLLAPASLAWSVAVLLAFSLPALIPVFDSIVPRHVKITVSSHVRSLFQDFARALSQIGLNVIFLGHQAWMSGDALARTLYRLAVSRQHLLEWLSAAQVQRTPQLTLAGYYGRMWGSLVIAAAAAATGLAADPLNFAIALPFVAAWMVAPAVALWVSSRPTLTEDDELLPEEEKALRLIARRTWRFFETFVTAENSMLPPDNFQEDPEPVVARRTSPTNIGLYLLCCASARDFGWAGLFEIVERIDATFGTLRKLEKLHGHFYNWYATADLRPLDPRYVSTVDSGNMAGHLLALANACREWAESPFVGEAGLDGIQDCLDLAVQTLQGLPDEGKATAKARDQISAMIESLSRSIAAARQAPELLAVRLI